MTDEAAVLRMAYRDAAAHLRPARYGHTVRVRQHVLACPWCGATHRPDWAFPLRAWQRGPDWAPATTEVRLTLLACERLTARALLPLVDAVDVEEFSTRAATWLRLGKPGLATLDEQEARTDTPVRTLPVAVAAIATPASQPHFLTPHRQGGRFDELNTIYLAARHAAIARELGGPAHHVDRNHAGAPHHTDSGRL